MFKQKDEGLVLLDVGDLICSIPFIIAIKVISLNNGLMIILLPLIGILKIPPREGDDDERE